jgi:hypothetical protein
MYVKSDVNFVAGLGCNVIRMSWAVIKKTIFYTYLNISMK